ncbi:MAG: hypothetical protein JRI25_22235 [Deltaproteobacteria bacterium]|nr:hypothetical protein [Deltaproteobacteria bacterium]
MVRLAALLLGILLTTSAAAATLDDVVCCEDVTGEARERVEQIAAVQYLYDCCEDTVAACLAAPDPCPLSKRLAGQIRGWRGRSAGLSSPVGPTRRSTER